MSRTKPDQKSYRLTMTITNVEPGRPLYVMQSPVRVFEQIRPVLERGPFPRSRRPRRARRQALRPSYLSSRSSSPISRNGPSSSRATCISGSRANSLISERSEPDDDIIDRTDRYYVYLKPHGADDNAIRKRMNYKGDPPVYMPMPPH